MSEVAGERAPASNIITLRLVSGLEDSIDRLVSDRILIYHSRIQFLAITHVIDWSMIFTYSPS